MSSILSKNQINILSLLSKEKLIVESFYLTGGTALAEFYLQHRLSEDLDFFSEKEFDPIFISTTFKKIKNTAGIVSVNYEQSYNRNLFFLELKDDKIKIDLYFILIYDKNLSLDNLIKSAQIKFDTNIDLLQLSSQFVKVEVLKDYPNMIKKIEDKEWQEFFMKEAKRLVELKLE